MEVGEHYFYLLADMMVFHLQFLLSDNEVNATSQRPHTTSFYFQGFDRKTLVTHCAFK